MKKQLQGFSLILFGVLLNVFGVGAIIEHFFGGGYDILPCFIGVAVGVLGLFFVFKKHDDKE